MEEKIIKKEGRIKIFDAVRALATVAVFMYHAGYLLQYAETSGSVLYSPTTIINWLRVTNTLGTVGVSTFFVLSGFLLFYQLYKEKKRLDAQGLKDYARKRLLRILPLYYFSIFFIVLVLKQDILFIDGGIKAIIYNMLFLRSIHADGAAKITIDPVYWSLIIEMHFISSCRSYIASFTSTSGYSGFCSWRRLGSAIV